MGPKKKGEVPSTKVQKKEQNRVIEDKTFGLKNKNKSKVVQNYVKSVENQVKHGNVKGGAKALEAQKFESKKKKNADDQAALLLAALFKGQQNLKNAKGGAAIADTNKIDYYRDPREGTENMPQDTIITCKFFLDAVEAELYGFRWECPNRGSKCQYRHCLPEGYVLLSKKQRDAQKKLEEEEASIRNRKTLEEQIEEERAALPVDGLTPVTKESFFAWKERRKQRKQEELEERMRQEELEKAMGRKKGQGGGGKNSIMNGRALFQYNPDLFIDGDEEDEGPATNGTIAGKDEEEKVAEDDDGQIKEKPSGEPAVDEALFEGENADEDVDFD